MTTSYYEVLDPRFARLFNGTAHVDKLYTGCRWAEGPAYFAAGRYVVWSDIPNDRMLRYDETDGSVSVFRQPAGNTNGNTTDRQGRLVSCEHGGRRVSRTEHDGTVITIADKWKGKRLNSPNDVVVKSDGSIWFTDPAYGIDSDYEGNKSESEIGACHVYRVDPSSGEVEAVITDMVRPNGLAFSLDESLLYVVDTGRTHGPQNPAHMRVFKVGNKGKLSGGEVFADSTVGFFDGFRLDTDGRIWTSAGDGIHCYDPDGTLIGKVRVPEVVANCVFGGPKRNILYICGTTSLYAVRLMVNGAKLY
ncbi:SMP-30/gluconolactonase/LRE family protein [Arvimicrobium flavum]|uniref:SMP-30/gluconolactonase/LRE family protein n=1 Tax=Arvimicrobium flavum TaxID=3393320 RepID=UPI00237ACE7C|nr:SMP-30/gluconolactonase/LRE family protein [Mesorhizobium shangrilense]